MIPEVHSLFSAQDEGRGETISPLHEGRQFRLERIVSFGAASEPDSWYDQPWPEWVALVRGASELEFEQGRLSLDAGDYILIPARLKHRVTYTSIDAVWIAIHFQEQSGNESS